MILEEAYRIESTVNILSPVDRKTARKPCCFGKVAFCLAGVGIQRWRPAGCMRRFVSKGKRTDRS